MASEVYQDSRSLEILAVEAIPLRPGEPATWSAYPHLRLEPTSEIREITFDTVVLENPFLKVTLVPSLGGRILGIFDKRGSRDVLPIPRLLRAVGGGHRGARLDAGIEFCFGAADRPNGMGSLSILIEEAEDDEAAAAVWLGECLFGHGLSFNARVSLAPDQAAIDVEGRVFNRSWTAKPYHSSIALGGFDSWVETSGGGLAFTGADGVAVLADGIGTLSPFRLSRCEDPSLGPRQLDTFTFQLVPFTGVDAPVAASPYGVASVSDARLKLHPARMGLGSKLLLGTRDGNTLEASADLYPEQVLEIDLSGLESGPVALSVREAHRDELLRWDAGVGFGLQPLAPPSMPAQAYMDAAESHSRMEDPRLQLQRIALEMGSRAAAAAMRAVWELREGRYADAAESYETALLFNGEDHLSWWQKALAHRLLAEDGEERPELLNAHFLAPLEPLLRAESFLSQSDTGEGASPLLASLADQPENFVEVACVLLEAGLYEQTVRWLEEAVRHADGLMLRYLLAYCYLTHRKDIEASEHLRRAAELPLTPPFPWRAMERVALQTLSTAFPTDERVRFLLERVDSFLEST